GGVVLGEFLLADGNDLHVLVEHDGATRRRALIDRQNIAAHAFSPGSRITRSGADIRAHECIEFRNFASVESQTPLGAPPNNVGGGQRPFVSHEVTYFSLIEIRAKTLPQRGSLRRISQQLACTR